MKIQTKLQLTIIFPQIKYCASKKGNTSADVQCCHESRFQHLFLHKFSQFEAILKSEKGA